MTPTYSAEILKRFVAIEGLDGAGTSTQSKLLERNLQDRGHRVVLSEEPTPGPIGTLIRQLMRGRLVGGRTPEETEVLLAHLFAADRHDHLSNAVDGIRSQVDRGFVAISTRYYFSSYAYNGRDQARFDLVQRLNADFPVPEVVVFLEVPVELSLERLAKRDVRELYEQESELRRVAEAYNRIFAPIEDRVIRIQSVGDVAVLAKQIADAVEARLSR